MALPAGTEVVTPKIWNRFQVLSALFWNRFQVGERRRGGPELTVGSLRGRLESGIVATGPELAAARRHRVSRASPLG